MPPRRRSARSRSLVNNAGVPSGSWFLKMNEEEWRSVLDVNLDGVFRVGQEARGA